jgi:teichuronic acid biosynthesis glycosyltransferase TuaC
MIKVLCLAEMYPNSVDFYTGSFIHRQNKALVEKGVELKVISPVPWMPYPLSLNERWGRAKKVPAREVLDGIEILHPRRPIIPKRFGFHLNAFLYYLRIRPMVKKLSEVFHFDLIHAHVALPDGLAGSLLKRDLPKPLVITVHGKDTANDRWSTAYLSLQNRKAISKAFQSSSRIIAVSNYVRRTILEIYPDLEMEKVVVVHGGVDPDRHLCAQRIKADSQTILSVGALIPLKGHCYTITAMKKVLTRFPTCKLMIVGKGQEKEKLLNQVKETRLQDSVIFVDVLPQDHLFALMTKADIFVLPSWAEGLGLVYLEAMARGLPVIGCRGQGVEDIVSHGETGLLMTPKDPEELADLILNLLKDENERSRIGNAGREFVLRNCQWETNATRHIEIYKHLMTKQDVRVTQRG